jgi:hypothetical protein
LLPNASVKSGAEIEEDILRLIPNIRDSNKPIIIKLVALVCKNINHFAPYGKYPRTPLEGTVSFSA